MADDDNTHKPLKDFLSQQKRIDQMFAQTTANFTSAIDAMIPKIPDLNLAMPEYTPAFDFVDPNHASEFEWRILRWINDFHRELGEEYEVGGQLVSFGRELTFSFVDVGYHNPSLISFKGTRDDGSPIELVQHVSQISILLIRQKRTQPEEPKRPIGFASWDEYDEKIKNR